MSADLTGVELTRTLGSRAPRGRALERAFEMGRLVEQMLTEHPEMHIASIRLSDTADGVQVRATARPDLVCPYCGDTFETELQYRVGSYSEHRDHTGFGCDNYLCDARWANDGQLVRPSKLSPGGDVEAQESNPEPPS